MDESKKEDDDEGRKKKKKKRNCVLSSLHKYIFIYIKQTKRKGRKQSIPAALMWVMYYISWDFHFAITHTTFCCCRCCCCYCMCFVELRSDLCSLAFFLLAIAPHPLVHISSSSSSIREIALSLEFLLLALLLLLVMKCHIEALLFPLPRWMDSF